jgi:hypothetical protein
MESPTTAAGRDESPSRKLVFAPRGGMMECASYGRVFKCIALALLATAAVWLLQLQRGLSNVEAVSIPISWLWLPWGLMATTAWFVCTGSTRLTGSAVEQSWTWPKHLAFSELAYAKLIRIRGLEWLIAPRLYTKNFGGKLQVFYAAAPEMLEEFKRLELALAAVRQTH